MTLTRDWKRVHPEAVRIVVSKVRPPLPGTSLHVYVVNDLPPPDGTSVIVTDGHDDVYGNMKLEKRYWRNFGTPAIALKDNKVVGFGMMVQTDNGTLKLREPSSVELMEAACRLSTT